MKANNKLKHPKKIILTIFSLLVFVALEVCPVFAANETTEQATSIPEIHAPSCILMNLNTGKILYNKNANEKMYPASTTKIMTAILTVENCNLNDVATVSHDAIFKVPRSYANAALVEGEELTILQLLNVLLIPSANDAAFVLAEHIGGTFDNFSKMMNDKAIEIGCKNTHFVNPNGIHDENHYTTAYDLALMGQYAMKSEIIRSIVSTINYTLPATNKYDKTDRVFRTTNDLIRPKSKYYYEYATGCKTGYTEAAKNCIIATAKKDNMELLLVLLHDEKAEDGSSNREIDCKNLFEYAFNSYQFKAIAQQNEAVETIKVAKASSDTKMLPLVLAEDITALIPVDYDQSKIKKNISLDDGIVAPITKGTPLGQVTYVVDGISYTSNLLAEHDVNRSGLIKTLLIIFFLIVIGLLLFIVISTMHFQAQSRKKKSSKRMSHLEYYQRHQ